MICRFSTLTALALALCAAAVVPALAQAPAPRKESPVAHRASGPFDVKTLPLPADRATEGTALGRYALDKQYHGDLEATGKGEMLGAGNPASGAAGYVAMEQVTGTLQGRKGSFALQHFGAMGDGKFELRVEIVPGSGTDELKGLAGAMTIVNNAGKHSYTLDYTLPE